MSCYVHRCSCHVPCQSVTLLFDDACFIRVWRFSSTIYAVYHHGHAIARAKNGVHVSVWTGHINGRRAHVQSVACAAHTRGQQAPLLVRRRYNTTRTEADGERGKTGVGIGSTKRMWHVRIHDDAARSKTNVNQNGCGTRKGVWICQSKKKYASARVGTHDNCMFSEQNGEIYYIVSLIINQITIGKLFD